MSSDWFKLPSWWINEQNPTSRMLLFKGGVEIGKSIAALKVYMALLLWTDNGRDSPTNGCVTLTLSEIEDLAGLSRTMVVAGIEHLEGSGLIEVSRSIGIKNKYRIVGYSLRPWAKLPTKRFINRSKHLDGGVLTMFRARGKVNLNALKLYLYLAVSVDRKNGAACRSYASIEEKVGIRRIDIRAAISLLIEMQLIKVSHEKMVNDKNPYKSPNYYYITGVSISQKED